MCSTRPPAAPRGRRSSLARGIPPLDACWSGYAWDADLAVWLGLLLERQRLGLGAGRTDKNGGGAPFTDRGLCLDCFDGAAL